MADFTASEKNILIVDDEEDVVTLIRGALESQGYQAISASNGEEAFQLVKRTQVDLVILDLNMPRMNGISFFDCIRSPSYRPDLPVLIITGIPETLDDFPGRNFQGVITKPFVLTHLMSEVARILKESHQKGASLRKAS